MKHKNVTPAATSGGAHGHGHGHRHGSMKRKEYTAAELEFAAAVGEVERTLRNIDVYREKLAHSPENELSSIVNALNGGYISPHFRR